MARMARMAPMPRMAVAAAIRIAIEMACPSFDYISESYSK